MAALESTPELEDSNFAVFRDCLSTALLRPDNPGSITVEQPQRRRRSKTPAANTAAPAPDYAKDGEELAEFIDYLATEIFQGLPEQLQELDHRSWRDSPKLQAEFALPLTESNLSTLDLSPSLSETLQTYNLIAADPALPSPYPPTVEAFIIPILSSYISTQTTPPPASRVTRASECEICERSWIPLSYHHLIPRFVHEKAVKRGWHKKEDLQNVAWLCGACHRFVHNFKNHEELARDYYTVELLLAEDEVQRWASWAGKLRWKGGNVRGR